MAYTPRFGSKERDELWSRERLAAHLAGRGNLPICNICDEPVHEDEPWDESHDPAQPKVFGGKSTGIAHARCNRLHGAQVVKPQVAKCDRIRKKHLGLKRPGMGRHPLPAGVRTKITRTMKHGVKPRLTLSEKLARMRAKRAFGAPELTA